MWYTKLKAWAALFLGVYIVFQAVAAIVAGSFVTMGGSAASKQGQGTIGDTFIGLGVFGIVLGLVAIYLGYKLGRWGWANI